MSRFVLLIGGAALAALVPAAVGLAANPSLSTSTPVAPSLVRSTLNPSTGEVVFSRHHGAVESGDDSSTRSATEPGDDHGAGEAEPGDDHGSRGAEPGDDHGSRGAEPGDDHGSRGAEPGDDHGSRGAEPGDDHGSRGAEPGDDHGGSPKPTTTASATPTSGSSGGHGGSGHGGHGSDDPTPHH